MVGYANFEDSHFFNFGANNSDGTDLVTAGIAFRLRIAQGVDLGLAYQIPLTEGKESVIDDRFTVDLVRRF